MNDRSPLYRFVTVSRDFGLAVALRVAYSKVRGRLYPALALPGPPAYNARHREVSIVLGTAQQGAATFDAIVEILAEQGGWDWEACICERAPVQPETARTLARIRGTEPRIRIVTTDKSVNDATAARWTVEQATGRFVALLAPGYTPDVAAIARLLNRLNAAPPIDAAILVGTDGGSGILPSRVPCADCRLLLLRKSRYLAAVQDRWLLTAPALAEDLHAAGVPIAYVAAWETELSD